MPRRLEKGGKMPTTIRGSMRTQKKDTAKDAVVETLKFGAIVWAVLYGLGAFLCALGAALPAILIIWLIITGFFGS